jgi:8-oxo-dGTP diphosphatase
VELLEHKSARWLRRDELNYVEWLPADVSVVNSLRQ